MANASKVLLDLTTELLSQGATVRFRPSGRSMYPSIREGELITVEPVQASDVKLADIVLYRSERGLIAHRVVQMSCPQAEPSAVGAAGFSLRASSSRDSRVFRLQGDASLSCDQPVAAEQILGRVVGGPAKGPQRCSGHEGSQTVAQGPPLGLWGKRVDLSGRNRFSPRMSTFGEKR